MGEQCPKRDRFQRALGEGKITTQRRRQFVEEDNAVHRIRRRYGFGLDTRGLLVPLLALLARALLPLAGCLASALLALVGCLARGLLALVLLALGLLARVGALGLLVLALLAWVGALALLTLALLVLAVLILALALLARCRFALGPKPVNCFRPDLGGSSNPYICQPSEKMPITAVPTLDRARSS